MAGCSIPMSERVPLSALIPFVRSYLERYDTYGHEGGFTYDWDDDTWDKSETLEVLSPVTILAAEAGISASTLTKYLAGRNEFISLSTADRLLTAMGRPDLWHVEPLASVFESLDLDVCELPVAA